jgi:hypothetical protein
VEVEEVVEDEEEQPENPGPALPWMQAAAEASKAKKEVTRIRKMQPVHSLAVQGDALWAVSGTEVSRRPVKGIAREMSYLTMGPSPKSRQASSI